MRLGLAVESLNPRMMPWNANHPWDKICGDVKLLFILVYDHLFIDA
jgi:hypothetical protein